jgi:hypothetical protein
MATTLELLREGRREEIWHKYCGFIDLSLDQFMEIQKRLLMEQIGLLGTCELGRKLMGEETPGSVDEFRQGVRLTTYAEYAPYFLAKREDVLPAKPYWWLHTSGRSGEYEYKWVPYSDEMAQKLAECSMVGLIFASCSKRGEFVFNEHDNMLFTLAPFPYISGAAITALAREFNYTFVPPMDVAIKMDFQTRIMEGFRLALRDGMDSFNGLASVLARVGDQFVYGKGSIKPSPYLLHPLVAGRLLRALMRALLDGRTKLLPKDVWDVKCIGVGGTDTRLFKEKIAKFWGRFPIENYACTEGGFIAAQLWNGKGMTCYPDCNFLEFLPEEEIAVIKQRPDHKGKTVLFNEVQAGKRYEVVVTNLRRGAFVRYRVGDIVEFISLRDEELNVNLPQLVFYSRINDLIDIAGVAILTEGTIWEAIASADLPYADWVATKEYDGDRVLLHIYVEPKGEANAEEFRQRVHGNLQRLSREYADLERVWNMEPLRLTLLPEGAHKRFYETRVSQGADLAHMKPPHMNPSERVLRLLQGTALE